jgi:predicted DNA binding CopG/RHH family protein
MTEAPKPMTKKQVKDEAEFAAKIYKNRAAVNRDAQAVLKAMAGARQVTIRLDNIEIELAKEQAKAKGLKCQTYLKMLLHQALVEEEARSGQS